MTLMPVLFIASFLIITIYFTVFMKIWLGWNSISNDLNIHSSEKVKISVIVAARNEENNLPQLINDLENQTYSKELYDVIIVDDHSEKKISELPFVKELSNNFFIYLLSNHDSGKKKALLQGAKQSNAEMLLFTDADCRIYSDWIKCHAIKYAKDKPGLTIGLVDYFPYRGLLKQFFRFDFISLVITGAGSSYLGKHTLCNGANLAVKRELYLSLAEKLRPDIPSGDDVFLLHEVKKSSKETVSVLKSKLSVVKTIPPGTLAEFISQRIRWASKGKYYSDIDIIVLGLLVFLTNIASASLIFICFIYPFYVWIFLSLVTLKLIADGFIIGSGLKYFGKLNKLWLLPVFEIIYPIYMLLIAAGGIVNAFTWKSRKV